MLQRMDPEKRSSVLGTALDTEGLYAVVHGHGLDLHRDGIDLAIDHSRGDHIVREVGQGIRRDRRRQILQDAAIVISQELPRREEEKVRPVAGREGRRQPCAVDESLFGTYSSSIFWSWLSFQSAMVRSNHSTCDGTGPPGA